MVPAKQNWHFFSGFISSPPTVIFLLSMRGTRLKNLIQLEDMFVRLRPHIYPNLECIAHLMKVGR